MMYVNRMANLTRLLSFRINIIFLSLSTITMTDILSVQWSLRTVMVGSLELACSVNLTLVLSFNINLIHQFQLIGQPA